MKQLWRFLLTKMFGFGERLVVRREHIGHQLVAFYTKDGADNCEVYIKRNTHTGEHTTIVIVVDAGGEWDGIYSDAWCPCVRSESDYFAAMPPPT